MLTNRRIIICGGGLRYFPSAWLAIRSLRVLGATLPVEIWLLPREFDRRQERWLSHLDVDVRVAQHEMARKFTPQNGMRAEWAIKPHALLSSNAQEVIFLDADNLSLVDPSFLLQAQPYQQRGAIFWPDYKRTGPERAIWEIMGIPYRDEPEFETGQMVINKERCGEALEFALWMNQRADFFYNHIWGDKDTFRFAWHKFGLPYAMIPHPIQPLTIPGAPPGHGVMCQHDFEGNRIFQHRNMAKWDLLGENPRIPGFLYEQECRDYLAELRRLWNGRLNWKRPQEIDFLEGDWAVRQAIAKKLTNDVWLIEDRRPKSAGCCGPAEPWSETRKGKPWITQEMEAAMLKPKGMENAELRIENGKTRGAETKPGEDAAPVLARGLRSVEVSFLKDGVLGKGAAKGFYFWDVEKRRGRWTLRISGEKVMSAELVLDGEEEWSGRWRGAFADGQTLEARKLRLRRVESEYPVIRPNRGRLKAGHQPQEAPLHLANHAFGIGDAVTGYYAAVQVADAAQQPVLYHTRLPQWLERVEHPLVMVTDEAPPSGTPDMDVDYAEQLRYARDKVAWYRQWAGADFRKGLTGARSRGQSKTDREIRIPRLEFSRYVILAPFAAWESRDWPQANWRRLAWLLDQVGITPVAIGVGKEAERMQQTFDQSNAYWAVDHLPEWIMDAMLGAEAVIGLDSGMVHLAGLLQVPTLCIHSHLPPEFLFSAAPTVKSVTPQTDCVFCRWQEDRRYTTACGKACSALGTVGPEAVMTAMKSADFQRQITRHVESRVYSEEPPATPAPVRGPVPAAPPAGTALVPPRLWFTSKNKELNAAATKCVESWRKHHPGWELTLMDDAEAAAFVKTEFGGEIWRIYKSLPLGVMRADFWRYLVVYKYGGIYADTDAECREPSSQWIGAADGLVVGLEDLPNIINWTFAAKPEHPALWEVIQLVLQRARKGWQFKNPEFVHYHTGPELFRDGILAYLGKKPSQLRRLKGVHAGRQPEDGQTRIYPPFLLTSGSVVHQFASSNWGGEYGSWKQERWKYVQRKKVARAKK